VSCPDLGDISQGVRYGDAPFTFNSKINYECNKGYRLAGSPTLTCKKDGMWDSGKPSCQKICKYLWFMRDRLKPLNVIIVNLIRLSDCLFGLKRSRCFTGKRDSSAIDLKWARAAQTTGSQSHSLSQFLRLVSAADSCPKVKSPRHGLRIGRSYSIGSVVTVVCDAGYQVNGTTKRICRDDATWSGVEPTCQRKWWGEVW